MLDDKNPFELGVCFSLFSFFFLTFVLQKMSANPWSLTRGISPIVLI